jgi:uncharacterized membrane protein YcaP (DUF421 family)
MLCKYKDVFGKPKSGPHNLRIFDFALFDIICTFLGAFIIAKYFKLNYWITLISLFILGIILINYYLIRSFTRLDKK